MTGVADLASGAPGAAEAASADGEASLDAPPVGAGPLAPLFEASELLSTSAVRQNLYFCASKAWRRPVSKANKLAVLPAAGSVIGVVRLVL